ncbi:adenylylsulfatase HINT3 [Aristolochia californica]|uniref:adenylylsulfatase HINT3 n=1 Tax=Aristolochia californica TaxID=171875 RepID=UPI0035D8C3F4
MEHRRLAVLCSHLRPTHRERPIPGRITDELAQVPLLNSGGGYDQGRRENGCIFCMIVRGESPAFKLYEDDVCLCILDLNPLSHGHSLIIPKSHFSSLEATPPSIVAAMCSKVPFLCKAIMKATQSDSFNLLVNNGAAAGQVIFHTHLHMVPRKAKDRLWTSHSFRRTPLIMNQETAALANSIREHVLPSPNDKDGEKVVDEPKLVENQQDG